MFDVIDTEDTGHSHELNEAQVFHRFLTAGNATFTLVSGKTGARYTFKVRKAKKDRPGPSMFFVSTLIGSDNESDYAYLGFFTTMHGDAHVLQGRGATTLAAGRKGKPEDVRFKALDWLLTNLRADRFTRFPAKAKVYHEGRCGKCNRKLTVPSSIESGLGPKCAAG